MRCDRVDFEPGGIAYRHVHPGPGIRCLLYGAITIDSEGERARPTARASRGSSAAPTPCWPPPRPTSRRRSCGCMLLPAEYEGQRTIRYVDPADADKPKTQRATIFLERPSRGDAAPAARSSSTSCVLHGADLAFGVPGESYLAVLDALHDAPLRLIATRHEAGAANMAEAYGKLTGRPGHLPGHPRPGRDARERRRPHRLPGLDADAAARRPGAREHARARGLPGARLPPDVRRRWPSGRRRSTTPTRVPEVMARAWAVGAARGGPGRWCVALPEDMLTEQRRRARRAPRRRVAAAAPGARELERLRRAARGRRAAAGRSSARAAGRAQAGARRRRLRRRRRAPGGRLVPLPGLRRQPLAGLRRARRPRRWTPRSRGASPRPTCCSRSAGGSATSRRRATRCCDVPRPRQRLVHVHPDPDELGAVYQPELAIVSGLPQFAAALARARRRPRGARDGAASRSARRLRAQPRASTASCPGDAAARRRHGACCASGCATTRSSPAARATSRSGRTASTSSAATRRSSPRAAARWATASRRRSRPRPCTPTAPSSASRATATS